MTDTYKITLTAISAPLAPQFWWELELKSPRIGGFRGLTEFASVAHSSENGCKPVYSCTATATPQGVKLPPAWSFVAIPPESFAIANGYAIV